MSFNYAAERNKFDAEWSKLRVDYAIAGMSQEAIEQMYQFDLDRFNADRAYASHHCPLNLSHEMLDVNDDFENPLLHKYWERFTTQYDTYGVHSRYWWLEELSDPRLVSALPFLSQADKELLTLKYFEQRSTREIAKLYSVTHVTIAHRLKKLSRLFDSGSCGNAQKRF